MKFSTKPSSPGTFLPSADPECISVGRAVQRVKAQAIHSLFSPQIFSSFLLSQQSKEWPSPSFSALSISSLLLWAMVTGSFAHLLLPIFKPLDLDLRRIKPCCRTNHLAEPLSHHPLSSSGVQQLPNTEVAEGVKRHPGLGKPRFPVPLSSSPPFQRLASPVHHTLKPPLVTAAVFPPWSPQVSEPLQPDPIFSECVSQLHAGHIETHLGVVGTDLLLVPDEPVQAPHIHVMILLFWLQQEILWGKTEQGQDGYFAAAFPYCPIRISVHQGDLCKEPHFSSALSSLPEPQPRSPQGGHCCSGGENNIVLRERQAGSNYVSCQSSQQSCEWKNLRKMNAEGIGQPHDSMVSQPRNQRVH